VANFHAEEGLVGGSCYDAHKVAVTDETVAKAHAADAVIFGAVGGPKWDKVPFDARPEAGLLRLRKDLGLFANIRPAIVYPALADASSLKREAVEGLDIIILRELTGGVYFGEPKPLPISATGRNAPSIRRSMTPMRSSASRASVSNWRANGAIKSPRWKSAT